MPFCLGLNRRPLCQTLPNALTHHRRHYKTRYYQKLYIYYEVCQLTETLLNDEVGNFQNVRLSLFLKSETIPSKLL